jgi:hypothetical protein
MNLEELKTIHLVAKEWVDDNDYSYFSAKFILNADKFDEIIIKIPFQYWYGSLLNGLASQIISEELGISPIPIYSLMNDYGVRVSAEVITNCSMKECIEFTE